MFSAIKKWIEFLDTEIKEKRILPGVFKPVQHYLIHIPYMIEKQGVLKAYSGRSMERTIGRYKKLIRSKVDAGANAGNILVRFTLLNYINRLSVNRREALNLREPKPYTSNTFESLDTNDPSSAQLWSPIKDIPVFMLPCDVSYTNFKDSLSKFLERLYSTRQKLYIPTDSIVKIAGRAWFNDVLYTSKLYQQHIKEYRRGNYYVVFNATHVK